MWFIGLWGPEVACAESLVAIYVLGILLVLQAFRYARRIDLVLHDRDGLHREPWPRWQDTLGSGRRASDARSCKAPSSGPLLKQIAGLRSG